MKRPYPTFWILPIALDRPDWEKSVTLGTWECVYADHDIAQGAVFRSANIPSLETIDPEAGTHNKRSFSENLFSGCRGDDHQRLNQQPEPNSRSGGYWLLSTIPQ